MAAKNDSTRLHELGDKLASYYTDDNAQERDKGNKEKYFIQCFRDICSIIRNTDKDSAGYQDLLVQADGILDDAISWAYSEDGGMDYMESFADSDSNPVLGSPVGGEDVFRMFPVDLFLRLLGNRATGFPMPALPGPWPQTMKPHPLTTRLSRFKDNVETSATSDTTTAQFIYQAGSEITDNLIPSPINIAMSSNNVCMAIASMGGYKDRSPMLQYYLLDEATDFPDPVVVEVGLSEVAYRSTIDETRKLIFVADSHSIKSYAWGPPSGDNNYADALPKHTMDTGKFEGPVAILPGGRFIRAGEGGVGVWNLDTLKTHGPKGKARIGSKFNIDDSWRDDPESIERSSGSVADTTIKFEGAISTFTPAIWHAHPSVVGTMLWGNDPESTQSYSCLAVDLEDGGKIVTRFLGHGGGTLDFSTSSGDANMFATACSDGYARLYDVRQPLPVLTLDAGKLADGCPAVALVHPDGIPTVFTGAARQEEIQVWDIRAKTPVYELSTGNNAVVSLAWDEHCNTLYAATECRYVDRLGYHHDYRPAKIPKGQDEGTTIDDEPEDEDNEWNSEEEDDDDDDDERCWPKSAYHKEDHFGYLFDAGTHSIFRYAFKDIPDSSIVPAYGSATLTSMDDAW